MTTMNHVLQLTLFENMDRRQANYLALYDLAPRFAHRSDRKEENDRLEAIKRVFDFAGETYSVTVKPARVTDSQGRDRDMLPGEREQLVEDVIRKFAGEKLHLGEQEEVLTRFSLYAVQKELASHNHTFSRPEIKEAFQILNLSNITIAKLAPEGERRPKPVVSAPAFPTLMFRDDNDTGATAYVQLNPLLAQAIKSLAYDQVNYEWMMQLRTPLPRWVFKSMSLLMGESAALNSAIEIRASDIINSFGQARARWREMLSKVEKALVQLKELSVIADYIKTDVKDGRKKVDVVYQIRFSDRFIADRKASREQGRFIEDQAHKRSGKRNPSKFVPITAEDAAEIRMAKQAISGPGARSLSH